MNYFFFFFLHHIKTVEGNPCHRLTRRRKSDLEFRCCLFILLEFWEGSKFAYSWIFIMRNLRFFAACTCSENSSLTVVVHVVACHLLYFKTKVLKQNFKSTWKIMHSEKKKKIFDIKSDLFGMSCTKCSLQQIIYHILESIQNANLKGTRYGFAEN